jgi:hypothetical protein
MRRLAPLPSQAGRTHVALAAVVAGVIMAIGGASLVGVADASRARAASVIAPPPCPGSTGSSVLLYAGSFRIRSQTTIPVCASGGVTVSFHSTAQGCAAGGPCGYAGTETWRPTGSGQLILETGRQSGRDSTQATLLLGVGDAALETVTRTIAAGRQSSCRDRGSQFAGFLSPRIRGAELTFGLGDGRSALLGPGASPLLGTQCAGPLDGDVGAGLPRASVALAQIRAGHHGIDLSSSHPFVSRDFAGEVSSDLVLNLGRAHTSRPSGGAPRRGERIRSLSETYRVQRLRGQITTDITGSSDPAVCARLDGCGARGAIHVAARGASGARLVIGVSGPARRPLPDFLAALGRRRGGDAFGLTVSGGGDPPVRGAVTAHVRMPARCRDTAALSAVGLRLQTDAGRMQVALSAPGGLRDPLRTRCPGPALGSHELAAGGVPLTAFAGRTVTVTLHGVRSTAGAYRLRSVGSFSLTLRLVGQSTQIFRLGV